MLGPDERLRMIQGGLLAREPLVCDDCGAPILPGERALCGDGYVRAYGEFALSREGEEPNWPHVHERCVAKKP